jgi:UDP-N-acetylmuramate dehydrogenase
MILDYLEKNKDITNLSNYKLIAKTKYYFEIHTWQDIDKLYEINNFAKENNLKILFIWWGTNVLFAFDLFNWIIIKNCLEWWNYNLNDKILDTYSNESISDIAEELFNNRQVIWKRFIWLPWSIWWAIFWNAWCFWLETENNFFKTELYNIETWKIETFFKKSMEFTYRNSIIKKTGKYFIIKASFDLSSKEEKYSSKVDNIEFRETKQPKWNTCGSFFKNPSRELSAGKLIEDIWLKWKNIWWAYFSTLHANFLMNDGSANYKDMLNIINLAKKEVKNSFNIELIPEIRIITN